MKESELKELIGDVATEKVQALIDEQLDEKVKGQLTEQLPDALSGLVTVDPEIKVAEEKAKDFASGAEFLKAVYRAFNCP